MHAVAALADKYAVPLLKYKAKGALREKEIGGSLKRADLDFAICSLEDSIFKQRSTSELESAGLFAESLRDLGVDYAIALRLGISGA